MFDYHSIILKDFVIARHRQNKPGAGCWENARKAANRISKKENRKQKTDSELCRDHGCVWFGLFGHVVPKGDYF